MQLMQATPIAGFEPDSGTLLEHHNRLILSFYVRTNSAEFV